MIIDTDYIKENSLNQELADLVDSHLDQVSKILSFVEKKIFLSICKEQFIDETTGEYTFPEDLQQTTLYLVESYYLENLTTKEKELKAVTLDDYKEEFVQDKSSQHESFVPLSFYGIPILKEYLDIIEGYICDNQELELFWTFSVWR